MTFLLTGASGLLGRDILSEAVIRGIDITGLAFSRVGCGLLKCDLTKPEEIDKIVVDVKPSMIIHAAAERFPDKVEEDYLRAKNLNQLATAKLASAAFKINCKFLYISTDYVFDGTSPPYSENDEPNPLNKYGKTKLEGEKEALLGHPNCSILRIPILYGPVEYLAESAVTTLLTNIKKEEKQFVSHNQKRYPASTQDVAKVVCDLAQRMLKDDSVKGIYQWSGKEQLTKYDMVVSIAKAFSLSYDHIEPDTSPLPKNCTRPFDTQLDTSRLEKLGISHHTPFTDAVKLYLEKWV